MTAPATGIMASPSTPYAALGPYASSAVPVGRYRSQQSQSDQLGNTDVPHDRLNVFQRVLVEKEFENAFISARVQRMQHGVYKHDGLAYCEPQKERKENEIDVTFVAITFVFHCMLWEEARFKRASIAIQAAEDDYGRQGLKIIKFAPHLAFGRFSTETLHWAFNLAGNIGVTQGPVAVSITPGATVSGDKVKDTMLRIQGSTRSGCDISGDNKLDSSRLVWSLEENKGQESGLPREFTFVFLVQRRNISLPLYVSTVIDPHFSPEVLHLHTSRQTRKQYINLGTRNFGQLFSKIGSPPNFATLPGYLEDLVELPGTATSLTEGSPSTAGVGAAPKDDQPSAKTISTTTVTTTVATTEGQSASSTTSAMVDKPVTTAIPSALPSSVTNGSTSD